MSAQDRTDRELFWRYWLTYAWLWLLLPLMACVPMRPYTLCEYINRDGELRW